MAVLWSDICKKLSSDADSDFSVKNSIRDEARAFYKDFLHIDLSDADLDFILKGSF